jgi:hypothetical protein
MLTLPLVLTLSSPLAAQVVRSDVPHGGSVEIVGAFVTSGGYEAGTSQALET